MFRNLRAILSVGRLPLRAESHIYRNAEQYSVRRVRFVRPAFTARRAAGTLVCAAGTIGFLHFILPVIVDDEEDGEEESGGGLPEQSHDGEKENGVGLPDSIDIGLASQRSDDDAIFIPLSWTRKCEVRPYRGSDPEWQEFLKFAHDRNRGIKVRRELAGMVGDYCQMNKKFSQRLGSPVRLNRCWIDIDFPDAPPPEYERSGIEITGDYLTWTTRPVSAQNYSRLQQALWPAALSNSFLATYIAVIQHNWYRVKGIFGADPREHKGDQQATLDRFFRVSQTRTERLEKRSDVASTPSTAESPEPSDETSTKDVQSRASASEPSPRDVLPPLPPIPQVNEHTSVPVSAFTDTLKRTWRSAAPVVPRGSIIVSGLVEVIGTKSVCVVDVQAAYNPAKSKWEVVQIGTRRMQEHSQAPKGGP